MINNPTMTVQEFLSQLEAEHAERAKQIKWLRKELGFDKNFSFKTNDNVVETETQEKPNNEEASQSEEVKTDNEVPNITSTDLTHAERIQKILESVKTFLSVPDIHDFYVKQGIGIKNFHTTLSTTLKRRKDLFFQDKKNRWGLKSWLPNN